MGVMDWSGLASLSSQLRTLHTCRLQLRLKP